MLRNCTAARYERQQGPHGARWPSTAATACATLRAEHRHRATTSAARARCSCSAPRSSSTASAKDIAILKQYGVPLRGARPRRLRRGRAGAGARCSDKFVGGLRLPGDETGDCFKFTQRLAAMAAQRGRRVPLRRRASTASRAEGGAHHRRAHRRGHADRRRLRASRWAATRRCCCGRSASALPVYPVKGYSITVPITDPARRARIDGHGRDPQGRDHAAGRPHPRRRHGGARRLRPDAARGAPARRWSTSSPTCSRAAATCASAEFWTGLRPMTPDGTPVVGPTPLPTTSTSPPATARWAGPWPPVPAA